MKKIMILAGICLAMCTSAIAQDFGQGGQRQGGQRMRRQMDAVVDTTVINHMDINVEVLQKVYTLQEAKQKEQKAQMEEMRKNRNGQRMSEEERNAFTEKQKAFTAQYRKELRAILGDEAYIIYLEKMLDRQGMMRMGGRPQMQGQRGGQRQGNFGGGDFPSGGAPDGGFGGF